MNADDSRMPASLVLRDLAVIALAIGLWQWSHVLHDGGAPGATAVAIVAGLLLTVSAYFVHEWGHLGGALASGSRVHFPRNAIAVFLFRFDVDDNGFHLAPGQVRRVVLRERADRRRAYARYGVSALNSEKSARFEIA